MAMRKVDFYTLVLHRGRDIIAVKKQGYADPQGAYFVFYRAEERGERAWAAVYTKTGTAVCYAPTLKAAIKNTRNPELQQRICELLATEEGEKQIKRYEEAIKTASAQTN